MTFQESEVQWFHLLAALKHFVLSLSHALTRLARIVRAPHQSMRACNPVPYGMHAQGNT